MPAINEQVNHDTILDRLEQQRHALARHLRELERQVVETSQHLASVSEHIRRERGRQ
jgi:hypothetical protein